MASDVPGWNTEDLRTTIREYVGSGYNQDAPKFAQFCHAAAKIIRTQRSLGFIDSMSEPSFFVLSPSPDAANLEYEKHPTFDRGKVPIAGRVWFGGPRLARAVGVTLVKGSDQERFEYMTENLKAGASPAIYYDATHDDSIMRVYPAGLNDLDNFEDLSLVSANLTLAHIQRLLNQLHSDLLITPTASALARDLWKDRGKVFPIKESERGIQKILHAGLTANLRFAAISVLEEGTSVSGRYDFKLDEQDPLDSSKWIHHAILELKVVKSFTHTGNSVPELSNQQAVTTGVDQATSYRDDHSCRMAAVCCYDMRKHPAADDAIAHELTRAQELDVAIWAWPIYASAKAWRTASVNKNTAAKD